MKASHEAGLFGALSWESKGTLTTPAGGAWSVFFKMCALRVGCKPPERNPKGIEVGRGRDVPHAGTRGLGEGSRGHLKGQALIIDI